MKKSRALKKPNFIYVGERSFWRYKSSGWGVIIPSIDCECLKINKNTVARVYVSYDKRVVVLKVVDTRVSGAWDMEEDLLAELSGGETVDTPSP